MDLILARLPETLRRTGHGRSTHFKKVQDGLFTRPVRISAKRSGWPLHEVETLVAARIAGLNDEQIRALVQELHDTRGNLSSALASNLYVEPQNRS